MSYTPPTDTHLAIPFLHELHVELELVRYDRPLCVLLKDGADRHYLAHFLDVSTENKEIWYIIPVDRDSLPRLLTGQIALSKALAAVPEKFRMLGALANRNDSGFDFEYFQPSPSLDSLKQYLPNDQFCFFEDEFQHFLQEELVPVASYAHSRLAEVIYMRLFGEGLQPSLFPLSLLADIGKVIQRLITNLSLFSADPGAFGRRGLGLHSVEHGSQFALTGIASGSVQLRLESIRSPELLGSVDPAYNGAKLFMELSGSNDPVEICNRLRTYPPRIRTTYLAYVAALQKTKAGLRLQWGTPQSQEPLESEWQAGVVGEIVNEVSKLTFSEENTFEATGIFLEGSMTTGRFKFLDVATNRAISGRLADELEKTTITLSLGAQAAVLYNVMVREVVSTTHADTTDYQYTFLDVKAV